MRPIRLIDAPLSNSMSQTTQIVLHYECTERIYGMSNQLNVRRLALLLGLAVLLVLVGGLLASSTQTAGGTV
jgi:hypothetical protein